MAEKRSVTYNLQYAIKFGVESALESNIFSFLSNLNILTKNSVQKDIIFHFQNKYLFEQAYCNICIHVLYYILIQTDRQMHSHTDAQTEVWLYVYKVRVAGSTHFAV